MEIPNNKISELMENVYYNLTLREVTRILKSFNAICSGKLRSITCFSDNRKVFIRMALNKSDKTVFIVYRNNFDNFYMAIDNISIKDFRNIINGIITKMTVYEKNLNNKYNYNNYTGYDNKKKYNKNNRNKK